MTSDIVGQLVSDLINEVGSPAEYARALLERGMEPEDILTKVFGEAARILGEKWNEDACTFFEVTVGVGRLQAALRELSGSFAARARARRVADQGNALLLPVTGEQHVLGIYTAAELLRTRGWAVRVDHPVDRNAMLEIVRSELSDVIGLSLSSERFIDAFREDVAAIRKISAGRNLRIVAGGTLLNDYPDIAGSIGVDLATVLLQNGEAGQTKNDGKSQATGSFSAGGQYPGARSYAT